MPFSEEFQRAYAAAVEGEPVKPAKHRDGGDGTVNALVTAFLSSPLFKSRKFNTQRARRYALEKFRERHGDKRVFRVKTNGEKEMLLDRGILQRLINEKAGKPFAQRTFLVGLRSLFRWAVSEGRVPQDPTIGVVVAEAKSDGFATWTETDIQRFEQAHPIGARARLALALLLYTGQRRSDVIRMGRQHIRDGWLSIVQSKTGTSITIPVHPRLRQVIEATPGEHLTFLTTQYNKPFSPDGFGHWFRECCRQAGLSEGLSAHGLRKACAAHLASIGCSTHEIASITGHLSLREIQRYTQAADRKRMATSAFKKVMEADDGGL